MKAKQTSRWNEIRAMVYSAAILIGAIATPLLIEAADYFSLAKGVVLWAVVAGIILLARYVVPPENGAEVKVEEPKPEEPKKDPA